MTNFERWLFYVKDYESPDLFITWGFYSLISAALQRRVWFKGSKLTGKPGHDSVFVNQFIVLTGPRACGKTRITRLVKNVCEDKTVTKIYTVGAGANKIVVNLPAITCTPDNITFEGLFKFLSRPDMATGCVMPGVDPKDITALYQHTSATVCLEELGVMFTANTEDVASVLCQCYDAGSLHRYTKTQGEDKVNNVCVNFLAGTTAEAMRRLLSNNTVEEGFASRVIYAYASEPRFKRFSSAISIEQEQEIIGLTKYIHALTDRVVGEFFFTPEAFEYMRDRYENPVYADMYRTNHDKKLDGYFGRKKIHLIKLAALVHFSEQLDSMTVGMESVLIAEKLLVTTELNMHLAFRSAGVNEKAEVAKDVIAYLKTNGETSYKKLFLTFYKDAKNGKQDFDDIVNYLVLTEQVYQNGMNYKHLERKEG